MAFAIANGSILSFTWENCSHKSTWDGDLIVGLPQVVTLKDSEVFKQYWWGAPHIDLSKSCKQTLCSGTPYTLDSICWGLA